MGDVQSNSGNDSRNDALKVLADRVEHLRQQQSTLNSELLLLRSELNTLMYSASSSETSSPTSVESLDSSQTTKSSSAFNDLMDVVPELRAESAAPTGSEPTSKPHAPAPAFTTTHDEKRKKSTWKPRTSSNIEKFIGENLINKIGIAITVIGVGIGAKYAIDHDLISPLTRIILGYLVGLGLFVVAGRLRKDYEAFSAVLLSGAMAIFYFISFAAYSFYNLIPQAIAFFLMVMFTVFTVAAAMRYDRQVIAFIGMLGAYAVPILLSDGSGRVEILFSYISIINVGLFIVALRRRWTSLNITAFVLTWGIFLFWFDDGYQQERHWTYALFFSTIFFITFYASFITYQIRQQRFFHRADGILIALNSILVYGVGYSVFTDTLWLTELRGIFTLAHAALHFVAASVLYRRQLVDRTPLYIVGALVLFFVTIAIPVQLDGSWVSICWSVEALALYWIGRRQNIPFYERLAHVVMLVAFLSTIQDWQSGYIHTYSSADQPWMSPIFNLNFLGSVISVSCFALILRTRALSTTEEELNSRQPEVILKRVFVVGLFMILLYGTFAMEITSYWNQLFSHSRTEDHYGDHNLLWFRSISLLDYMLFFVSCLSLVAVLRRVHESVVKISIVLNQVSLAAFCFMGFYTLQLLAYSLKNANTGDDFSDSFYGVSTANYSTRYVSFVLIVLVLWLVRMLRGRLKEGSRTRRVTAITQHVVILAMLSSELGFWFMRMDVEESLKMGLSILWGSYALMLIGLGIRFKQKDTRIMAIVLFGLTLLKLVLYDITNLDTIAKTIVFVGLGVLLLVISFLYNKYKSLIFEDAP